MKVDLGKGIFVVIETITPARAQYLLSTALPNRTEKNVERYALDMEGGRWLLSGQPIIVSAPLDAEERKQFPEGRLFDGNNRLRACVLSNTSFDTLVVYGVKQDVIEVVDTGKSRTLQDVMRFEYPDGLKYATMVGYIAKRIVLVKREEVMASGTPTTRQEEMDIVRGNCRVLSDIAARVVTQNAPKRMRSLMAFLYWYYDKKLSINVEKFFNAYTRERGYILGTVPQADALIRFWERGVDVGDKGGNLNAAVAAIESFLNDEETGSLRKARSVLRMTKDGIVYAEELATSTAAGK